MLQARVCQLTSLQSLACRSAGRPQRHNDIGWWRAQRCRSSRQPNRCVCRAAERHYSSLDANQLQTKLQIAVAAEDYATAAGIRDELQSRHHDAGVGSWKELGVPEWLGDRAEQFGLRFPTEVQARASVVLRQRQDCIIQSETGSGKTLSFLMPVLSQLDYPPEVPLDEFQGPQCVILVPTRELGVQVAMLVYKLFGGSVNAGIPGTPGNMFAFQGPRGLKVAGVLDKEEVLVAKNAAHVRRAHVLVATPSALAEVLAEPSPVAALSAARFLVVDEVDACFQDHSEAMEVLLSAAAAGKPKPSLVFVGATVQDGLAATAEQMGWMEKPSVVAVGQGGIPSGLQHGFVSCEESRMVAVLCRQIRHDLQAQGEDAPPARVIVFAASEAQAAALAEPLRNVLWGQHKISVLLPSGQEPIKALHAFRDNQASLLVATPAAARGLDLPAVSFVYNLGAPVDAIDYLHRAGRAGRIGATVAGTVVTLVTSTQQPHLQQISQELDFELAALAEPPQTAGAADGDVESQKQGLEDLYNLF